MGACRSTFSNYTFPLLTYTPTLNQKPSISHNTLVTSHPQHWVPEPNHPNKKSTPPTKHRVFRQNVEKVGCLNTHEKRPFYNVRPPKHTSLDSKTAHIRLISCWSPPPTLLGYHSKSHKKAALMCSPYTFGCPPPARLKTPLFSAFGLLNRHRKFTEKHPPSTHIGPWTAHDILGEFGCQLRQTDPKIPWIHGHRPENIAPTWVISQAGPQGRRANNEGILIVPPVIPGHV